MVANWSMIKGDMPRWVLDDMKEACRSLTQISVTLGEINTRVAKYLDRVEQSEVPAGCTRGTIFGAPESDLICDHCFHDCEPGFAGYASCSHALLCPACGPCDECGREDRGGE